MISQTSPRAASPGSSRWLPLAAALAILGYGGWSRARLDDPPTPTKTARTPDIIVRERAEQAERALDIITRSWARGAPVVDQPGDVHAWSARLLGTQIYLSMADDEPHVEDPEVYLSLTKIRPNPQRLQAFEEHFSRMRAWEDRLRALQQAGVLSSLGFLNVESRRLQAELWLARERQLR